MPDNQRRVKVAGRYRYTENYRMGTKLGSDGSTLEVADYIGSYLKAEHNEQLYKKTRIYARILSCVILCFVILLLCVRGFSVYQGGMVVFVPVTASLIPLLYLLIGTWKLPPDDRKVQEDIYRFAHVRIRRSLIGICILLSIAVVISLVFFLTVAVTLQKADLLFGILLTVPLISDVVLMRKMKKLHYRAA